MRNKEKVGAATSRKRGTSLGFGIFKIFLRIFGLHRTYGLLYFVCIYYLLFDRDAVASAGAYVKRRFHESGFFKSRLHIYRLFISQGKQLLDRFAAVASKEERFDISLKGYDELMALLRGSGKGVVLLTSHFGNWQVALTALNKLGKKVHLLMRREDNPAVHDALNVGREEENIRIISPDQEFGGVIEMINLLKTGDLVSIMGDRRYGSKASKIKFLGEFALFPFSAFAIAAAAEVPVVVLLAAKTADYKYEVDVSGVLYPECKSGKNKNIQLVPWIQKYADILAGFTESYPYQCFLFHDIWKTYPTDEDSAAEN
jgi:predicted LPLAT superfamily acyltransferase